MSSAPKLLANVTGEKSRAAAANTSFTCSIFCCNALIVHLRVVHAETAAIFHPPRLGKLVKNHSSPSVPHVCLYQPLAQTHRSRRAACKTSGRATHRR